MTCVIESGVTCRGIPSAGTSLCMTKVCEPQKTKIPYADRQDRDLLSVITKAVTGVGKYLELKQDTIFFVVVFSSRPLLS